MSELLEFDDTLMRQIHLSRLRTGLPPSRFSKTSAKTREKPREEQSFRKALSILFKNSPHVASKGGRRLILDGDWIARLKNNCPASSKIKDLLDWETKNASSDPGLVKSLRSLISICPPKLIAHYLGQDAVLWTVLGDYSLARIGSTDIEKKLFDFLETLGHSQEELCVCSRTFQIGKKRTDVSASFKTYQMYRALKEQGYHIPAPIENFSNYLRPGRSLSPAAFGKYRLETVAIQDGRLSFGKRHRFGYLDREYIAGEDASVFYLDAPIGVTLTHKGVPIAVASFWVEDTDTLVIQQFQGVQIKTFAGKDFHLKETSARSPWPLEPFRWKELLLNAVVQLAIEHNFSRIGIVGGKNQRWCDHVDEDGTQHLVLKDAERIYNQFAEDMLLKKDRNGNYYLAIQGLVAPISLAS